MRSSSELIKWGILLGILLTGCMPGKKLAQVCADKFPVLSSVEYVQGPEVFDTAYIPGDTLVLSDTIRVECDSARQVIVKPVYKKQACPPAATVRIFRIDTVKDTKVDIARAVAAETKVAALQEENNRKSKRILYDTLIIAALLAWTFRNPILGLVKKIIA